MCTLTPPNLDQQYRPQYFISVCLVANTPCLPTESGEQSALLTQEERLALMLLQTHLENVRVVLSSIGSAQTSIECP